MQSGLWINVVLVCAALYTYIITGLHYNFTGLVMMITLLMIMMIVIMMMMMMIVMMMMVMMMMIVMMTTTTARFQLRNWLIC